MDLYVTVADVKNHLRIDNSDEDAQIRQYILTSQEQAEMIMHRPIYSATDERAVTNDATAVPASIKQFILVNTGDLYKNREGRQEKGYTQYFAHLLDAWIAYGWEE